MDTGVEFGGLGTGSTTICGGAAGGVDGIAATLCVDCQRRAVTNPLRVLDCKVPEDQDKINALPKIADFLDADSRAHFAAVLSALDACGVQYTVNPRLVRGLDYYTRTTFEFTHGGLGAQNALLGGGRYDGLSEAIGGPKAPGIGFAIGADRLVLTLQAATSGEVENALADVYVAPLGEAQAGRSAGAGAGVASRRVASGVGRWIVSAEEIV